RTRPPPDDPLRELGTVHGARRTGPAGGHPGDRGAGVARTPRTATRAPGPPRGAPAAGIRILACGPQRRGGTAPRGGARSAPAPSAVRSPSPDRHAPAPGRVLDRGWAGGGGTPAPARAARG